MSSRTHCRCKACGARQVKDKSPEDYVIPPRCRACGKRGTLRPDRWMNNRWRSHQINCRCPGYWFIHRQGSKYCHFRASGEERQLGDPDFHDRYLERTPDDQEALEERAAILEFDAGLPRGEAEHLALQQINLKEQP